MIDMHCHILHNVDDGSNSLEKSVNMIKNAHLNGFTDIILTPHYSKQRKFRNPKEVLYTQKEELENKLKELDIPVNLYLGNEIDFTRSMAKNIDCADCLTLNKSKYVLLDFTFDQKDIDEYIYEVQLKGYKVIVAHPERYKSDDIISDIKDWRSTGALIQLDATSLTSRKSIRKITKEMIKQKLIDIVASDAHKNENAYDGFKKTIDYILKKTDQTYVDLITKINPGKIIKTN